jgi:hypothetical protein
METTSAKSAFVNSLPLSDCRIRGDPNKYIYFNTMSDISFAVFPFVGPPKANLE